uniref:Endonuclease 8-like 1 n=1 Tax=Sphenodon punctatus TaxID=8508 RepID=A0A8D0GYX8_SPHPU
MPEGPELHLASNYISATCRGLVFSGKVEKSQVSKNPEVLFESDAYQILATSRGKEVKLTLTPVKKETQEPMDLVFRFGMSGSFKLVPEAELPKHAHLRFYTKESPRRALCFVDVRRFGRWEAHGTWQPERGPCVMLEYQKFRENVLKNLSDKAFDKPICEALLNQKFFNGIGNYLRAEILYRLKIPPFEKARMVLEALQHQEQSSDLTLSKKVKLKQEHPDLLELCHTVPMEVIHLGGKGYDPESSAESTAFEEWLQCYCVPGMKSLRDTNGRTIWFQVGTQTVKREAKGSNSQVGPEEAKKPARKKRGGPTPAAEESNTESQARKPNIRARRKVSASPDSPKPNTPAATRKRQASAQKSPGETPPLAPGSQYEQWL